MRDLAAPLPTASGASPAPLRRALAQPGVRIGGTIVLFFILVAIFAPLIAPYGPTEPDWLAVRQAPSAAHLFGTDDLGRDVLSRVIYGTRASLAAGAVAAVIAIVFGVPLGLVAGYFGGIADMAISRCTDALLACPFLVLAIALAAFLGPSLQNAMIAIGISAMPIFIRLKRAGAVSSVKDEDYITAVRAQGLETARSSSPISFRTCCPSWSRPPSRWPSPSSPRPALRFWVLDSARQLPLGVRCSTSPGSFRRRPHGWRSGRASRSSRWCLASTC